MTWAKIRSYRRQAAGAKESFRLSISEGHGEETARAALELGQTTPDFQEERFVREVTQLVAQQHHLPLKDFHVGKTVLEIAYISADNGFRTPPEFSVLGKTLLNLDEAITKE